MPEPAKAETGALETERREWLNGQAAELGRQLLEARAENRRLRAENERLRQALETASYAAKPSPTAPCAVCGEPVPAGQRSCTSGCAAPVVRGEAS